MIALFLAAVLVVQDPPAAPQTPDDVRWDGLLAEEVGDEIVYRVQGLEVINADGRLVAGEAEVHLDAARYLIATGAPAAPAVEDLAPLVDTPEPNLASDWNRRLLGVLGVPEQDGLVRRLILAGDVLMEGEVLSLRCQRFEFDAVAGTTLAQQADLRFAQGSGPGGWPLRILADSIREDADGSLHASNAALTTCDFEEPHFEVRLKELHGRPIGEEDWVWSPSGAWLAIDDTSILPLPSPDFSTEESFLSVRRIELQSNSRMGQSIELEVGGTIRDEQGQSIFDWGLRPGFSTRRGIPLGAVLDYQKDNLELNWDLFFLEDQATDVHPFANRVGRDSSTRWRIRGNNRYTFDDNWRADLDLALTSDILVDPEFFSRSWREEDNARSELYVRRSGESSFFDVWISNRLDNAGFTPLTGVPRRARANAPTQLDRLPVARFEHYSDSLLDIPVGPLGGSDGRSPLNFNVGAEVGHFRLRGRDLPPARRQRAYDSLPAFTRDRGRVFAEAALPMSIAGWNLRPGARVQANTYNEDVFGSSSASRSQVEGFLEVGSLWVKKWDHGWEHRVLPQIRLRSASASGDSIGQIPRFDRFDRLRSGEVVEFSLRQFYHAPGNGNPWVDIDFLIPYYPDPDQPLDDELFPAPKRREDISNWGPGEVRVVWTPGAYGRTLEGVRVETRYRQNLHTTRLDEIFSRVTITPNEGLQYGAAWRRVDDRFSVGQFFMDWRIAQEWGLSVAQPVVFTGRPGREGRFSLLRYEHDFVFEIGVSRDTASGNTGFFFNLIPRFLIDNAQGTRIPRINR